MDIEVPHPPWRPNDYAARITDISCHRRFPHIVPHATGCVDS
jgi:hypothetical protein